MPVYVESSLTIELPSAEHVAKLDRCSGEGQSKFAAWVAKSRQEQRSVSVEYHLHLHAGEYAADDYPQYYADMKQALSIFRVPIAMRERALETASRDSPTADR